MRSDTWLLGGDTSIRRLGFGTVRLTGEGVWGPPPDRDASIGLLRRAIELGVNFIDTSNSYGPTLVEELIADALWPYQDGVVVASKGGLAPSGPGMFERDGRPASLTRACEESLRRLRLDTIDLYHLHAVDPNVPIEDSVLALESLRERGLIRHIGISNVSVAALRRAQQVASIAAVQNCYNVADRRSQPVLEICAADMITFIPWFPLARGRLAEANGVIALIADERAASVSQVALAWLLQSEDCMIPIPGTNNRIHLEDNLGAVALELSVQELTRLDQVHLDVGPLVNDPSQLEKYVP